MATRTTNPIQAILEKIVAKPPLATLTVGSSIVILVLLIEQFSKLWPDAVYLRFLVPFIPPFFITRTAKKINQRRAEYHFVKDARPYIFIAFPKELTVQALLQTPADMFSTSAEEHFQCSTAELLKMEALPKSFFADPAVRETIVTRLIEDFNQSDGHGTLGDFPLSILPKGAETPTLYILNSVLILNDGRLKWQATLTKHLHLKEQDLK